MRRVKTPTIRPTPNAPMMSFLISRIARNPTRPAATPDAGLSMTGSLRHEPDKVPRNKRFITS